MTFPDFTRFFEICRDAPPYPWQERLARQVLSDRRWPDALDLPTGSGKTSAVDIALYALAKAAHDGEYGLFPRRIILIVDRRILVDQAWRHGQRLLERLTGAADLVPIRDALAKLSPEPASSIRLRGACPTDPRWCRSPDQVQIIASTVDQIGSRLLLRGYGVTPRMRSVEAGLVGQDTLFLLDEAHLAGPFLDTLDHLDALNPVRKLASRRHVVQLSATAATSSATVRFGLNGADRKDAALGPRLRARKTLRWSDSPPQKVLATTEAPCVLLVANTVRTALDWFAKATKAKAPRSRTASAREPFLITGRMRPVDRQRIIEVVERRLNAREPTLVVATQCIEAGVDWDFDAMISECAAWDALVQRMGRVNRRGERDDAECVVVDAQRTFKEPETEERICPVYGRYEIETANWLRRASPVRCPPGAMPQAPPGCIRPPATAPLLIPEYLDLWSQTRADGPAYDVSVFLHGVQQDRNVQVVWRDLDLARDRSHLETLLKALPPSSREAAPVPIREMREWLGGREVVRLGADIAVETADSIGVGVTVVVPATYGGVGPHGTFDGSGERVRDVSTVALREHRGLEFRFHEAPAVAEDEPIEEQVRFWIAEDDSRSDLHGWDWVDVGRRWLFVSELPTDPDDDGTTFQRRRVSLESHLNGVEARARAVADRLGLTEMAKDLALAARLHDLGKLDDRFQRLLGRRQDAAPLAQSGHSWIERRRRAAMSDYPKGERHEALSVELMIRHGLHEGAEDAELVEHLVASHHGWARPFVRAATGSARIDDSIFRHRFDEELAHVEAERAPGRFRSVQHRFGWLGLAWLEAILQLSDHRQVEAQKKGDIAPTDGGPLIAGKSETRQAPSSSETALAGLNGLVPGDYLAAIGVLRALDLADERVRLRWHGTQPRFVTALGIDEIMVRVLNVRASFRASWPSELNKLSGDECNQLLLDAEQPFRSLVVALLSPGGRSAMDFVSGGRSGFKSVFDWATTAQTKAFSSDGLRRVLLGPRTLATGGKSFRWGPLAAQGARRPQIASKDKRTEPWVEWLSVIGVSALIAVPEGRWGRLATRSTCIHGRGRKMRFRWPLWQVALAWPDVAAALAGSRSSLRDALWCEAARLSFGPAQNRTYAFGAGQPLWT